MRYANLAAATLLLAASWIESAGAGPEFGDFVAEGGAVGATQVEVGVFDLDGKQIGSTVFPVEDNNFRGALPLPIGTEVELHARALDRKGNPLATGTSRVHFGDMQRGAERLQLMTEGREVIGAFLTSPIRLEVTSERIDEERMRFFLHGFDAHDERIEIDAELVSWSIPFPLPGDWVPCKPSGVDPIPCIEMRIPLRHRPEIFACVVGLLCKGGSGGSSTGYLAISAGKDHTCALTTEDKIVCWGSNMYGQVGSPAYIPPGVPEPLPTCQLAPPLDDMSAYCSTRPREIDCPSGHPCRWIALDAGGIHTCAIDINKNMWCWGYLIGCTGCGPQMGLPQRVTPPTILGDMPVRFRQVSAGAHHSCGISERGNVICWGYNVQSQSGGPATTATQPRHVVGQKPFIRISAGRDHTCATTSAGELECWGSNRHGEIQPGNPQAVFPDPVNVRQFHSTALVGAVDLVAAGFDETCAHSASGGVVCWGVGSATDTRVHTSADTDLELGGFHQRLVSDPHNTVCDIRSGDVYCGLTMQTLQKVAGLPAQAYDTTAGQDHYCSVHADGRAFCWGKDNEFGKMGDGTQVAHSIPVQVIAPP